MQSRILLSLTAALVCAVFTSSTQAQPTAFSYQGSLADNGNPANGFFDIFTELWDAPSGGAPVGTAITNTAVEVVDGVFTVTLDFGAAVFDGNDRWLEIGVVTNGGGAFSVLSPRQRITSAPYAIRAGDSASAQALSGTVSASQLTGTISSNNIEAKSITSVMLADGAVGTSQLADGAVTANKLITTFGGSSLPQAITDPFSSAAVSSVGEDKLLIGSPRSSSLQLSGVVFVYDSNGTLLTTITNPTPAQFDYFGDAVSGVGTDKVIIGAYSDDTGVVDAGAAYLYNTGGTLLTTYTNPAPETGDRFGGRVSGVGSDKVLIAAFRDNTGADAAGTAYLYDTNGTLLTTYTNPTPANSDLFGISVSGVGSDKVIIGAYQDDTGGENAGAAYLYDTSGTLLTTYIAPFPTKPFTSSGDRFGEAVTSVGDDKVLIGAYLEDDGVTQVGAAYLYDLSGTLLTTITNPTAFGGDRFGDALSSVGNDKVLIGAPRDDAGANDAGAAYLFDLNGILLATYTNPMPASDDWFGDSVTGVGSDTVVVGVGGNEDEAAYLYDLINYTPGLAADNVRPGSITSLQMADGAVTSAEIADGAVSSVQLADGAVSTVDIADGTITTDDLGSNVLSGTFWRLDGNAGTTPGGDFLGTTDTQPLQLRVNNEVALRLERVDGGLLQSINVIGGYGGNYVGSSVVGATVSGGGGSSLLFPSLGSTNRVLANFGAVGGGANNTANGEYATVSGGTDNTSSGAYATVGGGSANNASGFFGTIGGGSLNIASGTHATVGGGLNCAATNYAFAAGRRAKANHQGTFVWADSVNANFTSTSSNQFLIRASGGVGIGVAPAYGFFEVQQPADNSGAGLAIANTSRGRSLRLWVDDSNNSRIDSGASGSEPLLLNGSGTGRVGIGTTSPSSPLHVRTPINVDCSMRLVSGGSWSLVMNQSPESVFTISNGGSERLAVEPGGDVGIGISNPTEKLHVAGNILATGTITPSSDRNLKKNFDAVDPQEVLTRVASLPIQQWTYKAEDDTVRHVGPMAQDFHAAFGLGANDVTIATVDADGVALAAIQGLNEKVEQRDAEIAALKCSNASLEQRLAALERIIGNFNSN